MTLPTLDITGNLTSNPDLKYSPSGTAYANGQVAANRSRRDQNGEWETTATLFQQFTAFGSDAEALADAGTGSTVRIVGVLETEQWEDKQTGQKRSASKLKADFARVLKKKQERDVQPHGRWGQ